VGLPWAVAVGRDSLGMVTSDASHDTPVGLKVEISGWKAIAPLYDAARLQNQAKELRVTLLQRHESPVHLIMGRLADGRL